MKLKTLSDLWRANKKLDRDFKSFKSNIGNYKNQKLVNALIKSRYWCKNLEDFSPEEREEVMNFVYSNYSWITKLLEYYND